MRTRWVLFLASMSAVATLAQISTAELAGTITDESGGVIRNVEVTLTSANTAARRVTHTDASGRYNFEQLPPAGYRLTAQIEGFQTEVAPRIELTIGRKAFLDLRLKVGEIKTETIVPADAELVDTHDASLSNVMESTAIRELPLNGRDFAQLALLQPGVAPSVRSADSGGPGTKLVIEGNRPSQVSSLMDGSDINDASNNTPGSAAGFLIGVDTLQEFRVVTNA